MSQRAEHDPYGALDRLPDGRWQLRFARELPDPLERVWAAVSEPEHLAHWFPTSFDGERRPGAPLRFVFRRDEAPPMQGTMIAYEPPSLIEFQWGPDTIRIELEPLGEGTLLTLRDTLETHGKAARDGAGWHVCLASLAAYVAGRPAQREDMSAWHEVHPHYVASFGPEAATIGPPAGAD